MEIRINKSANKDSRKNKSRNTILSKMKIRIKLQWK